MNRIFNQRRPRIITELENELLRVELRCYLDRLSERGITMQSVARTLGVARDWLYNLMKTKSGRPVPPWLVLAVKAIEAGIPATEPVENRVMESLDRTIEGLERELNRIGK